MEFFPRGHVQSFFIQARGAVASSGEKCGGVGGKRGRMNHATIAARRSFLNHVRGPSYMEPGGCYYRRVENE